MFPSLQTVTINTSDFGSSYKFGLRTFLESLVMMPRALTLIVVANDIGCKWAEDALNEDISAEFDAAGWNIKWVQEKKALVIKSKSNWGVPKCTLVSTSEIFLQKLTQIFAPSVN